MCVPIADNPKPTHGWVSLIVCIFKFVVKSECMGIGKGNACNSIRHSVLFLRRRREVNVGDKCRLLSYSPRLMS